MGTHSRLNRNLSAILAALILIPSFYFSYTVGRGMYYEYVLFPRLKAEDHYIAPTRWQDFAFLAIFWTAAFVLFFVSFRLIRFAFQSERSPRP